MLFNLCLVFVHNIKFNLKINIIPNGLEKYMSLTSNNKLSFIDSFQFLRSSLDSLVKKLKNDDFQYLSQEFDNDVLALVKQKGFYLIAYKSDLKRFKEELGIKEKFYSLLNDRKISDREYKHTLNAWKKLEIKMMKGYHGFYLKCDVLLLADMFEKFRNKSLKNDGLCTSYYLSASGLSWDAMLKMTKIELELIPDPDIFEKGTTGGISYISNRYSKTNNTYLKC